MKLTEGELATTQKVANEIVRLLRKAEEEKKAVEVETCRLSGEGEATKAKCKKAEQENEWLRQEMEELRAGFTAQNEELEGEYQKQVDEMFFFDYRCCMKKHGITQDTPSYPSDDEDTAVNCFA